MKKSIIALASIVMIAGAMTFTSCNKEDITAPVITITGGNAMNHTLNATFTAPAATATDDEDGDISSSITIDASAVNEDLTGSYNVTYTVTDAAGNTATETLVVTVVNIADMFTGAYNADDTCQQSTVFPYVSDWTASTTVNGDININDFGGFGNSYNINADYNGSALTVTVPQTIGSLGSLTAANASFTTGPLTVTIVYTWNDGVNNETCTSVYVHQ